MKVHMEIRLVMDDLSPPRYSAKSLPKEGIQASTSSEPSSHGQHQSHSDVEGASSRREMNGGERPGLETQQGGSFAYAGIRNPTPLSNNEIHNSQRRVPRVPNLMPQDFHVREPGITTGHGGVRAPSTSSNPTVSLR